MDEKSKMAIVIRSFNRGGAEVLIREMFENAEFNKNTGSCDLIILDSKRLELLKDLKNVNYHIFNIFSSSFFQFFRELRKLYKLIKEQKYSVLHSHLPAAGIIIRFLKLLIPKIKLVYSEHNVVDVYNKFSFFFNGLTYFKNDYTIFVSAAVKNSVDDHSNMLFYFYKRGTTVLNGVNADKFLCPFKNELVKNYLTIGTVINIRKEKRLDRWIEVVEAFKNIYPNIPAQFIIAGDGPERKTIEKLVSLKKLNSYIEFPGLIAETVAVYNKIDIFLMTSEFEGLPVALLEAMACACIPVTSNVGGIKHLDFADFGYKYEVFNATAIAEVIFQYYNNKTKIITERKKAREFIIQHNSLNKQVQAYIDIYNSL